MMQRIPVELPGAPYDVVIGRGLLGTLDELGALPPGVERALVVTQAPVARHHVDPVLSSLRRAGIAATVHEVPDGERAKSPDVLAELWGVSASMPLRRHDLVIALGGGVVGDLGGFLAATVNRGVRVVQIPTTLLAQVDAAVGGKTGINLPEGKNLVGAFHQPFAVIADIDALSTLEDRVRIEGLGEILKYGLIRDQHILALLEERTGDAVAGDPELLETLVRRSIAVKAAVVAADEREAGERAHLNLGHTFGHVIETMTDYEVLHGEAVAIGTVVALELGARLGHHAPDLVGRVRDLAVGLGLPVRAPRLDRATAWRIMGRDKKADRGVRFVVLDGIGAPVLISPSPDDVDAAIDATEGGTAT